MTAPDNRGVRTQHGEAATTDLGRQVEEATVAALATARSLRDAASAILEGICHALGWDFGALWTVDADGSKLRCDYVWMRNAEGLAAFETLCYDVELARGRGLPGRVWDAGEPAWIRDVVVDPNFPRAGAALEVGLHSAFAFPVSRQGEFFGVMEFFSTEIHEPDHKLLAVFDAIATQIGTFIEWDRVKRELEFRKAILEALSEASLDGIVAGGLDNRTLYWNERYLEMWKVPRDIIGVGRDGERVIEHMANMTLSSENYMAVANAVRAEPNVARRDEINLKDGRIFDRWTTPIRNTDGTIIGRMSTYRDITEQRVTERSLRRSEQWVSFLAGVSTLLSQELDYETALQRFARLAVPWLGDWCAIHTVEPDGSVTPVAVAHIDQSRVDEVMSLQSKYPGDPDSPGSVADVVRTRESVLYREIGDEMLVAAARDEEHLAALRALEFRSAIVVPIICRDRALGTLTLVSSSAERLYDESDLKRAEELAARASYPIDNARLFAQNTSIAETLQRSLLPPALPDIPGVDLVARYIPAGVGVDVGGDFYDAYQTGRRSWGLALGDVTGKGVEAAAVTSLARHTLRAASMTTSQPSFVLSILNQALLEDQSVERFCTAVYAHVEPRFGRVLVTLSCAGHPHPYVIRSNGDIEEVNCEGTLLGFVRDIPLNDVKIELQFGDKLILYTDGITDVRVKGRTAGEERLMSLLEGCRRRGVASAADYIAREVLEMQEGHPRDDLALLIVGVRSSIFRSGRRNASDDDSST
jgi:serine phosphatase RsbU (regulator of sigma subunit)/PAS domain-containing protein